MKRKIFLGLVLICLILLTVQVSKEQLPSIFDLHPKSGLRITSLPEATVYINNMELGKTPFEDDNLTVGEYLVNLSTKEASWQGKIKLTKGTLSIINRSLASGIAPSSGESLVLDNGKGVVITSSPAESEIEINGKMYGQTPLSLSGLSSGEYTINLSHDGYQKRSITVTLPPNSSLHINVDLALLAVDLNSVPTPTIAQPQKILIKQTPLGYVRVRENPGISSKEIGRVSAGDELMVITEVPGWVKIRLPNNQEGYVSGSYIQKISQ